MWKTIKSALMKNSQSFSITLLIYYMITSMLLIHLFHLSFFIIISYFTVLNFERFTLNSPIIWVNWTSFKTFNLEVIASCANWNDILFRRFFFDLFVPPITFIKSLVWWNFTFNYRSRALKSRSKLGTALS